MRSPTAASKSGPRSPPLEKSPNSSEDPGQPSRKKERQNLFKSPNAPNPSACPRETLALGGDEAERRRTSRCLLSSEPQASGLGQSASLCARSWEISQVHLCFCKGF